MNELAVPAHYNCCYSTPLLATKFTELFCGWVSVDMNNTIHNSLPDFKPHHTNNTSNHNLHLIRSIYLFIFFFYYCGYLIVILKCSWCIVQSFWCCGSFARNPYVWINVGRAHLACIFLSCILLTAKTKFICQTSYFVMDDETMAVWHLSRTWRVWIIRFIWSRLKSNEFVYDWGLRPVIWLQSLCGFSDYILNHQSSQPNKNITKRLNA